MPSQASLARLAIVGIVLVATTASAQVVCTTPDGKIHAGTRIPQGCAVKEKYRGLVDPGRAPSDPAASRDLARRADIRRERAAITSELRTIDGELAAIPEIDPAAYANDPPGWQAQERDLAIHDAAIERLRGRQTELRWRLESLEREAAGLGGRDG